MKTKGSFCDYHLGEVVGYVLSFEPLVYRSSSFVYMYLRKKMLPFSHTCRWVCFPNSFYSKSLKIPTLLYTYDLKRVPLPV